MKLLADRLLEIKRNIEEQKTRRDTLRGKLAGIKERLESDFSVKSIAEAEKLLDSMKKKRDELETQIEDGLAELEKRYGQKPV